MRIKEFLNVESQQERNDKKLKKKGPIVRLQKKTQETWPRILLSKSTRIDGYTTIDEYPRQLDIDATAYQCMSRLDPHKFNVPINPIGHSFVRKKAPRVTHEAMRAYLAKDIKNAAALEMTKDVMLRLIDRTMINFANPYKKERTGPLDWKCMVQVLSQMDLPPVVMDRVKKKMELVTGEKADIVYNPSYFEIPQDDDGTEMEVKRYTQDM